jgi:outer membrane protein assembly complex protein YaeT
MRGRRIRSALPAAAALAVLAVLAAPFFGFGQEEAPPAISKVFVLVDGRPARGALAGLIPFKPGDPYSSAAIDRVVKQVYLTGLFSDVRVSRSGEEKVELTFALTRNLIIRAVHFKGIGARKSRLREAVETLRPGGVFVEDRLPKAVEELREGLRREGYFDPRIVPASRKDPDSPRVDVSFRITDWKRYRIGAIEIQGPAVVRPLEIRRRMKSQVGRLYVPSRLDRDIQAVTEYYTSLGYRRAEIRLAGERFDDKTGKVVLELGVDPREKILLIVNGAKVPSALLAPIWEERVFEEWGLAEGEVRLLNYMRKKGFVYATLKSRIERTEGEVRVVYDVAPGKKYEIQKVIFEGLKSFSAQRLTEELIVSERVLFFSLLSYDRLFALPREIEYFYRAHGFPDVRAQLELPRIEKGVNAILKVEEGPRQVISSITLAGARLFAPGEMLKELVSVQGGPYFPPNIQRDAGILENYYLNHGVRGTKITPRVASAGENLLAVTFEIEEGTPVIVENILVTGNRLTRMSVFNKEIQVRKGAPADTSLIQESKRRLERLGIFSEVRTDEILTEPGKENLVVTVQEGETNYAGVGIGVESSPVPAAEPVQIRPRATAEYIRSNVFGIAAQLSLIGQYSDMERRAIVSWNQPYLFGIALRPALLGWIEKEDRTSFTFERRGGSLNLARPLLRGIFLLGTLSWSRTDLSQLKIPESDIDRRLQHYSTALASFSVVLDRRDDTFNPEKGFFFSAVTELAKPLFGTESDFWKTFFKFQYFRPIVTQVGFSLLARAGLAEGEISVPERFFAGGSNSFRGASFDYLGPLDATTGKPEGGRALFLLNAEVRFPIIPTFKELSGAGFFDLGNVFRYVGDFRLKDLEGALGLGLRYKTALGPVRFEMAWKLNDRARRGKPLFFITIGNVF